MHVQGGMQCRLHSKGTGSDCSEGHAVSASACSNPCNLCQEPSGIKAGKPSPWLWSRSTSFKSPDNPF